MSDTRTADKLRRCPLFSDLGDEACEALAPYFSELRGAEGDRLFNQGDRGAGLFVITRGTCLAIARTPEGIEQPVTSLAAPTSFGELSLLLRNERMLSVQAAGDVELLELDLDGFRKLKLANPDLCLVLIMAIVRRFGRVVDQSGELFQRLLFRQLEPETTT